MHYIILDMVINTYLNINSYLFLLNINKTSLLNNILYALFLDLFIFSTYFILTSIIILLYIINIKIINKLSILLKSSINLILFLIAISFIFNKVNYLEIIMINLIYYLVSYILSAQNIKLNGMIKYGRTRKYSK